MSSSSVYHTHVMFGKRMHGIANPSTHQIRIYLNLLNMCPSTLRFYILQQKYYTTQNKRYKTCYHCIDFTRGAETGDAAFGPRHLIL